MPSSDLTSTMMVNVVYKKVLPATTHDIPWHDYFPLRRGCPVGEVAASWWKVPVRVCVCVCLCVVPGHVG